MEARSCSYQRGDCTYSYWVGSANDPIYVVPGRGKAQLLYMYVHVIHTQSKKTRFLNRSTIIKKNLYDFD